MPILGILVLLIQFSFAYHVFKTGRPYWWIFVIMAFPVMGCVIYYFVEVFPGSREHRSAFKASRRLARALQPDAELKRRAEELEICGSVDNKLSMAEECMAHRMYVEAGRLYESCASGMYANDPVPLLGMARAAVEAGAWDKAESALSRLKLTGSGKGNPGQKNDAALLEARQLQGQGRQEEAMALYRQVIVSFVGLEARYRYGCFLMETGQPEAANQVFDELLLHAKRHKIRVESELEWVGATKRAAVGAR